MASRSISEEHILHMSVFDRTQHENLNYHAQSIVSQNIKYV